MPKMIPQILTVGAVLLITVAFVATTRGQSKVLPAYWPPLEIHRMIVSIKACENWDGYSVGRAGERGPMQFTEAMWYRYTMKPHRWAEMLDPLPRAEQARVEIAHVKDCIVECQKLGKPVTPYWVALVHNAGATVVASGRIPAAKRDFASRVQNVYEGMKP